MKKSILFSILVIFVIYYGESYSQTVYVTKSGKKFHTADCRYINYNSISLELKQAVDFGYSPCKVCKPVSGLDSYNYYPNPDKERQNDFIEKENYSKVQCSAITKKGTQCKRMTKSPNGYCWQHGGN